MAKATGVMLDRIRLAPGRSASMKPSLLPDTLTFKEVNGHIIISKKITGFPYLIGKWQYQKELFCYADEVYRYQTNAQRHLWLEYYKSVKQKLAIAGTAYEKKKKSRFAKKRWGYHNFALWVYQIFNNTLGNYQWYYLKTRVVLTELEILHGQTIVSGYLVHEGQLELLMSRCRQAETRLIR